MAQQLDLAQLRSSAGLVLYENLAYVPIRASVPGRVPDRLAAPQPGRARRRPRRRAADHVRRPPAPAPCCGARPTTPSGRRRPAARSLRHQKAFGWANGYRLDTPGPGVDRVRRAVAALGAARRRARDLGSSSCGAGVAPACGATRSCGRPTCVPDANVGSVDRSPSTTSSTTTRSGGSGCERPRRSDPGTPPSHRARCAAVRSSSSSWPRWSPRSWCSRARRSSESTGVATAVAARADGRERPVAPTSRRARGTAPRARRRPTAAPTRPSSSPASRRRPSTPPSP